MHVGIHVLHSPSRHHVHSDGSSDIHSAAGSVPNTVRSTRAKRRSKKSKEDESAPQDRGQLNGADSEGSAGGIAA